MNDTLTHRQLQSLFHVSNVINSSLDIATIIDSIMKETISVVEAADGGALWLYDPHQDCLVAQSAQGAFYPHIFRQIRIKPGESMTGMTFAAKRCLVFPNEDEIKKALSTLNGQNNDLLKRSIPYNFHFTSVISAPILSKGNCIGVITLDSFQLSLHFNREDRNLLEAICHQAAVALEKASLYMEKEKTVNKLRTLNQTLSQSLQIHSSLAHLVLQGEGLHSIIRYIHQTIGHHTLLFDDLGELRESAYDSSISAEMIDSIKCQARTLIETPLYSRSVIEMEINGEIYEWIAWPLGSKPKFLGMLTILTNHKMSEMDLAALEHACTVISLELVKEQAIFDTQQRLKGEFMDRLVSGKMDEALIQQAKSLNFDPMGNYMAIKIQSSNLHHQEKSQNESMMRDIIHLAQQFLVESHQQQGMVVRSNNQIIVLLSIPAKTTVSFIIRQMKLLAKQFQHEVYNRYKTIVPVGIGRIKSGLLLVHKSLQEANKCLKYIDGYQFENQVLSYTDLGVHRFIMQNSEEDLEDFVHEVLGPLIEYEKSRKGDLLLTLFVYLECNQNVKETIDALHIHTNTLNYRLKRIEEILSINFTESKLLNIHLAVNMYQYLNNTLQIPKG